jgi:hypothetical protein
MTSSSGLRYQKALTRFLKHLEPPATILEVNSERLAYTKIFFEMGYSVIDVETIMTDIKHPNRYAINTIHQPLEEIILSYRSIQGIWAHQSYSYYSRKQLIEVLEKSLDWLAPEGVLSFCMPEGEGEVVRQSLTGYGNQELLRVFYQADELAAILEYAGFVVAEAWREEHNDINYIHVICVNPR